MAVVPQGIGARLPRIHQIRPNMPHTAKFRVDPRITEVLGEGYRTSEQAIKELVDNAWDADADRVDITLPDPMTLDPVIIGDSGSGMTAPELEQEYLNVGRNRRDTRGDRTKKYQRLVKGRKGVGKFAGLMVADCMEVAATARGVTSIIKIRRSEILGAKSDFGELEIPVVDSPTPERRDGTVVTLVDLHQHLTFPNPDKLRALLIREYGREEGFQIWVNGQLAGLEDLPGKPFEKSWDLANGGKATLKFKAVDGKKKLPDAGIAVRVDDKIVGAPQLLGLEANEIIPNNLKGRIYGELTVTGMDEHAITADGGSFVENNKCYQEIKALAQAELEKGLEDARGMEMRAAKARYQKLINQKLEKVPEYRRTFATRALERVLERFYFENEERFDSIISVVLDALEREDYWLIMQNLEAARHSHVAALAEALAEFGVWDLSLVGTQAHRRRDVLNDFRRLIDNNETTEAEVHRVLEKNMWLLEIDNQPISSNQTIKRVIEEYLEANYNGTRAKKRPDLLVAENIAGHHLIIELKAPNIPINRDHEKQGIEYRDDLQGSGKLQKISVLLLGKGKAPEMSAINEREGITILSYHELISRAENRLKWLIADLKAAS